MAGLARIQREEASRCDACQLSDSHSVFELLSKCQVVMRFAEDLVAGRPAPAASEFDFDVGPLGLDKNLWATSDKLGPDWGFAHDVELVKLVGKVGAAELAADQPVLPAQSKVASSTSKRSPRDFATASRRDRECTRSGEPSGVQTDRYAAADFEGRVGRITRLSSSQRSGAGSVRTLGSLRNSRR